MIGKCALLNFLQLFVNFFIENIKKFGKAQI